MFFSLSREAETPPFGIKWRASYWFVTFVVWLGVAVDILVYTIVIPVVPFQLEYLGYRNVSSLTGYLLFAFSGGLVLSTIPIAVYSERFDSRKSPMVIGTIILVGSQIMFMEAPVYWLMCIARVLQGLGSTMIWVVGLALLCDSTPHALVGRQLGIAMTGLTLGTLIGPTTGGGLYQHFGFRGPFIFGIIGAAIDFVGRVLIVERKNAIRWGYDPAKVDTPPAEEEQLDTTPGPALSPVQPPNAEASKEANNDIQEYVPGSAALKEFENPPSTAPTQPVGQAGNRVSLVYVLVRLLKDPRAMVASFLTFSWGLLYSIQEPTIPLHLNDVWRLSTSQIGLVFLAAFVTSMISTPLSGWLSDTRGPEWVNFWALLLALPWWGILVIEGHLALFIVCLAAQNFFVSSVIAPLTSELATTSRNIEGVGYAHVYGAFNLAYGVGSCVGPIVGGQIYDNVRKGWMALCILTMGILVLDFFLSFAYTGNKPLLKRLVHKMRAQSQEEPALAQV